MEINSIKSNDPFQLRNELQTNIKTQAFDKAEEKNNDSLSKLNNAERKILISVIHGTATEATASTEKLETIYKKLATPNEYARESSAKNSCLRLFKNIFQQRISSRELRETINQRANYERKLKDDVEEHVKKFIETSLGRSDIIITSCLFEKGAVVLSFRESYPERGLQDPVSLMQTLGKQLRDKIGPFTMNAEGKMVITERRAFELSSQRFGDKDLKP